MSEKTGTPPLKKFTGTLSKGSLVRRVLWVSMMVFALPLLFFFSMVFRFNYQQALDSAVLRLQDLQQDRVEMLSDETRGILLGLRVIEDLLGLGDHTTNPSSQELSQTLTQLADLSPLPVALTYISTQGETRGVCIASSHSSTVGRNFSSYPFFKTTLEDGEGAWLHLEEDSGKVFYDVAQRIEAPGGHPTSGMLMATFPADYLVKKLTIAEQDAYRVDFSLLRADHTILATSLPHLLLHKFHREEGDQEKLSTTNDTRTFRVVEKIENAFVVAVDDKEYLAIQSSIPATSLFLLLAADKQAVFAEVYSNFYRHLILALCLFVAGSFATWLITQRMAKPFNHLVVTMNKVQEGQLQTRYCSDRYGFELNTLGLTFNHTLDSLLLQTEKAEQERVQKETYLQELQIGHDIQLSILPQTMPKFAGVEVATRYLPAKQVGGDFYDLFIQKQEGKERLVCTVGDTSGKGISACLYSLGIRSILRSYGHEPFSPSKIAILANNLFCEDTGDGGMFVTTFLGILDEGGKTFSYFSAGHNPAYLRRKDGRLEELSTQGIAMGVISLSKQEEKTLSLVSGDLIVIYSDGVTESHNAQQELYGTLRLEKLLQSTHGTAEEIADAVIASVKAFENEAPQHDDITLMVLKVL